MISDSALKKLSLLIAVAGIVALFIFTQLIEPKQVAVSEITNEMIGQCVLVRGNITSFSVKDGNAFFVVDDGAQIRAVWFNARSGLEEGNEVTVEGTVELYKNELEIIVKEIKQGRGRDLNPD